VPGRWDKGQSYLRLWENGLDTARRVADVAAELDMTVGLENVENHFLLSPREWCEFLDAVNSPHLRMYFDPGNLVYLNAGDPADWARDIGARICRVHLKDSRNLTEGPRKSQELVPLLAGNVPWSETVRALKDIGYDSWLSAELVIPQNGRGEFLKATHAAMRRIWEGAA
jgi:hexulose-6-phosphate isomerase